jgi:hypothetical protein
LSLDGSVRPMKAEIVALKERIAEAAGLLRRHL